MSHLGLAATTAARRSRRARRSHPASQPASPMSAAALLVYESRETHQCVLADLSHCRDEHTHNLPINYRYHKSEGRLLLSVVFRLVADLSEVQIYMILTTWRENVCSVS